MTYRDPENADAQLRALARRVVAEWRRLEESAGLALGTPLDVRPMREAVDALEKVARP